MTDIEQKALALVNEVRAEAHMVLNVLLCQVEHDPIFKALCRAIERHEAFRQEVSDAVVAAKAYYEVPMYDLSAFIIAKPDPLVVVLGSAPYPASSKELAAHIRADMKARGYEWRKIEGEG